MKKLHLDQNFEDALAQMRSLVDTMAARAEITLTGTLGRWRWTCARSRRLSS
jgi:hypothetical protein